MKFSVSSKLKPTRSKLLFIAGGVLLLAILVTAVAAYQVSAKRQAEADRAEQTRVANVEKARIDEVNDLKAQVKTLQDQKLSLCNNYKQLSTARATRSLVIVPTACSVNVN